MKTVRGTTYGDLEIYQIAHALARNNIECKTTDFKKIFSHPTSHIALQPKVRMA
jgi:hypothetical protein